MDPTNLSYCLFLLTCFSRLRLDWSECPTKCDCHFAPSDGISGNESSSLLCNDSFVLTDHTNLLTSMQTLVLCCDHWHRTEYSTVESRKRSIISIVLQDFTLNPSAQTNSQNSIFNTLDATTLKYLTIINGDFGHERHEFDWTPLRGFTSLEAIYLETTALTTLDITFEAMSSSKLHSLTIRSCLLRHIDRMALHGVRQTLRKLVITDNQLLNWIWLTASGRVFSHLWHVDLSINALSHLPVDLHRHLPALRVLYLAHNRFKYLSVQSLQPWLTIDELMLATTDPHNPKPDMVLYANQDVKAIHTKIIQMANQKHMFPIYLEHSLINEIEYDCPNHMPNILTWKNLTSCPNFDYFPDKLYLDAKGKLTYSGGSTLDTPTVQGVDYVQISSVGFTLDSAAVSLEQYRGNYQYLANQMRALNQTVTSPSDAVRLLLFGKPMLTYFTGQSQLTSEQIELIIDSVVELLDEAAVNKVLVLLCLWNYSHLDFSEPMIKLYKQAYSHPNHAFRVKLLWPLLDRISDHSALVGIELVTDFLSDSFSSTAAQPPENTCENNGVESTVLSRMHFLGYMARVTKQHSRQALLGVGLRAQCRPCLYYALHESCRLAMGFDGQYGLDFVTLVSEVATEEPFGPTQWTKHKPQWFDRLTADLDGIAIGLFYVLHEDGAPLPLVQELRTAAHNIAAGYFVVDTIEVNYVPVTTNHID